MKRHGHTGKLVGKGRPEEELCSQFRVTRAWRVTGLLDQIGEQVDLELIGHNHDSCNDSHDSDNASQDDSFVLCDPVIGRRKKHQLVPNWSEAVARL